MTILFLDQAKRCRTSTKSHSIHEISIAEIGGGYWIMRKHRLLTNFANKESQISSSSIMSSETNSLMTISLDQLVGITSRYYKHLT